MAMTFDSLDALMAALLKQTDAPLLVNLTPALAQAILEHDPVNRKVRQSKLASLIREISGGFWNVNKSTAIRFLAAGSRMADGQHRCRAVMETGVSIPVWMCVVDDTLGVDEGANRTLADHLQLTVGLPENEAAVASLVTKAVCDIAGASNRELLNYYYAHERFIMECVRKPLGWLADKNATLQKVFKPQVLALMRARVIQEHHEDATHVDQLLYDAIEGGATAPENSSRRELAKQFHDAMWKASQAVKKTKPRDLICYLLNALRFDREQTVKNILTARTVDHKKRRGPVKKAPSMTTVAPDCTPTTPAYPA